MEGFIMPSLPHLAVEEIKLSMVPSLQRHYSPSSLLRATPPSCCLQPLSRVSSYRTDLLQRFLLGTYRTSNVEEREAKLRDPSYISGRSFVRQSQTMMEADYSLQTAWRCDCWQTIDFTTQRRAVEKH